MIQTDKDILLTRIDEALDTVRPHLHVDGGDVEVVSINDAMEVQIRWMGMCESCSMSAFTLKAGIEDAIKRYVPEVKSVTAINSMVV
jgi:Fe-S cluster biogenesis protein NfuA